MEEDYFFAEDFGNRLGNPSLSAQYALLNLRDGGPSAGLSASAVRSMLRHSYRSNGSGWDVGSVVGGKHSFELAGSVGDFSWAIVFSSGFIVALHLLVVTAVKCGPPRLVNIRGDLFAYSG